jgi:hypothetical protein
MSRHLAMVCSATAARPNCLMSISVLGERVEEEQNSTLALLEARSREELAKAFLGIALPRSRASAEAVLFKENGQSVRTVRHVGLGREGRERCSVFLLAVCVGRWSS